MDVIRLEPDDPRYPKALLAMNRDAPSSVTALGNLGLLEQGHSWLAVFSSLRCPGRLILRAHDFAQQLRTHGTPVIGGFHSPVEQEMLTVILRGPSPVIICPARGLEGMRVKREFLPALEAGRLLFLSPFSASVQRASASLAERRNTFAAAISDLVFVIHAGAGSATERLAERAISSGKPVYTFQDEGNQNLIQAGASSVSEFFGEPHARAHPSSA